MRRRPVPRIEGAKVLLINHNQMKPPVIPLALDYLGSALKQEGFSVDILDLCFAADVKQAVAGYFAHNEVIAVGITFRNVDDTYLLSQDFFVPRLKELVEHVRGYTAVPIILGGSGFSVMPEAILAYCGVDWGIWGEAEVSLPLLLARLAMGGGVEGVPGVIYRGEKGFYHNPAQYVHLDQVPAPRRNTVDNYRYFVEGGMGAVETKRGCNKACIYCVDPVGKGRQIRLRSPNSVADEVEELLSMGIDHLHFCDSEFNLPENHAREVCHKLIERGLGDSVRWYAYASPAPFSKDLASLFRRAGCAGINFGVDSGSERMLRALGRDFSVDDLQSTAIACHRQGLVFMYDLLLGGPGETRESIKETIERMKRFSPCRVGAAMGVRVFPGTELARLVRKQGPLAENDNLRGCRVDNDHLFAPVFYLSSDVGPDAFDYLAEQVSGDERFFLGAKGDAEKDYNYNENTALINAIKAGYRGAFWDILRRITDNRKIPKSDA